MKRIPWLTLVVLVTFALAGPLGPWTAQAQQTRTAPASASTGMMNDPLPPKEPHVGHEVGAVVGNVFHLPGKAVLCVLGVTLGGVLMGLTFGAGYRAAVRTVEEGCGGTWVLTPEHMSGKTEYSGPQS
jgi:hypothetical protein